MVAADLSGEDDRTNLQLFVREIEAMRKVNSPHCVHFYKVVRSESCESRGESSESHVSDMREGAEERSVVVRFATPAPTEKTKGNQPVRLGMLMELADQGDLEQLVRKADGDGECLTVMDRIDLVHKIACGLLWVHREGYVHNDLKPANILVCTKGENRALEPLLADFGGARIGGGGGVYTRVYAAPEVFKGLDRNKASDVYSFGLVGSHQPP